MCEKGFALDFKVAESVSRCLIVFWLFSSQTAGFAATILQIAHEVPGAQPVICLAILPLQIVGMRCYLDWQQTQSLESCIWLNSKWIITFCLPKIPLIVFFKIPCSKLLLKCRYLLLIGNYLALYRRLHFTDKWGDLVYMLWLPHHKLQIHVKYVYFHAPLIPSDLSPLIYFYKEYL